MELRRVDPRTLQKNPSNPRKIQPGEMSDAAMKASIKVIGVIQPPTVSEKDGALTIVYGDRRVRFAIELGLTEINVLVKDPDDKDQMRAVSENVIRAPMNTVDLWRSIESLASENWTEDAIAAALAVPVRQIRKLRLLANVHPALLDQIGAGDMPREHELRTIASAPRDDQAAVWKKLKPKKGDGANWWKIAQALEKTRFFAKDAKFGEDERAAFGITWQEDLFAEGDEDNRFTVDGEAFVSAQRAWLDANMPKNGVLLETDQYGQPKLPPKAQKTWTKPKKGDQIGFVIQPRDGTVQEIVFRMPEAEAKKGKTRSTDADHNEAPISKKTRPEITHKGDEIIGALRTEALVKSLEVNDADDATLIGLLVLALNARNVSIQTQAPGLLPAQNWFSRSPRADASARTSSACASSRARCSPMSSRARSAMAIAAFLPGSPATPSAPTLTSAIWRPRSSLAASPRRRSNELDRACTSSHANASKTPAPPSSRKLRARPTSTPQLCSPSPRLKSTTTRKPRATIRGLTATTTTDRTRRARKRVKPLARLSRSRTTISTT